MANMAKRVNVGDGAKYRTIDVDALDEVLTFFTCPRDCCVDLVY